MREDERRYSRPLRYLRCWDKKVRFQTAPTGLGTTKLTLMVVETDPPDDVTPLEWLLITNVKVSTFSDALQRIDWYKQRWQIEVYFKVLKSGTKVERVRLETKDRLLRYIALLSIIAWRLYWLTLINRHAPDAECRARLT